MNIALIGLSGCGKTTLARRLSVEAGFVSLSCDDLIEDGLLPELAPFKGTSTARVAAWLGQPYESGFGEKQERYLELEGRAMLEVSLALQEEAPGRDFVIDTTGSFVHLPRAVQNAVSDVATIVYLETPEDEIDKMFAQFLADPKPVIWADQFVPNPGETQRESLARCYPELAAFRRAKYAEIADVTLPYSMTERERIGAREMLQRIRNAISKH